jgi:small subunit ribosomal protein S8e
MGISRDSIHKWRLTGGKKKTWLKKRKHEMGRQPSNTKIGKKQIVLVRARGGNIKKRALKLDFGNFSWISNKVTRKARIISVVYNASNNELVRTNTLVKGNIVYIDASPFKNLTQEGEESTVETLQRKKNSILQNENLEKRKKNEQQQKKIEDLMNQQIESGKFLARICSRPGQIGRADGYILEKAELEFYFTKIQKKKKF